MAVKMPIFKAEEDGDTFLQTLATMYMTIWYHN
jgi:hypothetical protein